MKYAFWLSLVFMIFACGTQDYPPTSQNNPPSIQTVGPPAAQKPLLEKTKPTEGYLWRGMQWVGVDDSTLSTLKTKLADTRSNDAFCAFGSTLLGGAAMGLVIRSSGSTFFGSPVESGASHEFWRKLNEVVKVSSQGVTRGALFTGGCYLLLAGLNPLPYDGLLGHNYRTLSAAISLGSLSAVTAAPFAKRILEKKWPKKLEQWSTTTQIGKGVRYQVLPGLLVLGIGSGIGLFTYNMCERERDPVR